MTQLIHQFLAQNAQKIGDSDAVVCREQSMTYRELDIASNKLANRLLALNVERGSRIGIYMDKSLNMAVSIYAALKAGCVYVPMDPNAPIQRLCTIVSDCDVEILLSSDNKAKKIDKMLPLLKHSMVVIGSSDVSGCESYNWDWVHHTPTVVAPELPIKEQDLAYIIYTSGSTGKPKGITHSHQSCLSFAKWGADTINVQPTDRLGNHCPLHFDISTFDWFAAVIAGACVVLVPEEYIKMPASYASLLKQAEVTVLYTVPFALIQFSQVESFTDKDLPDLRQIIFAGEPMSTKHLRKLLDNLPSASFHNWYGPAETNVCTAFTVTALDKHALSLPIGHPCGFAKVKIMSDQEQEVSAGQTGELWIHSPSTMASYWARPELNNSVFVEREEQGAYLRYYKTGDLVLQDDDGLIWFAGRKDRQVKIRGYRVELDEVEAALVSHDEVEEAAVFCLSDGSTQSSTLLAVYTSRTQKDMSHKELMKHIKSILPSYALPASIVHVEQLPRTSSGKIDRRTLEEEIIG